MLFSLQVEDQGLVELDLSANLDPLDFNWFQLCPWARLFFQKLCLPPFLLFHAPFLSPVQTHNVASILFWILWLPDVKKCLTGKYPDVGKD